MSYGYGLSVSLFQLGRAYTAIAHDGQIMPVSIFHTPGGDQPATGPQIFSPTTAREVRAMLETVTAPGGTSPDASVSSASSAPGSAPAARSLSSMSSLNMSPRSAVT